MTDKEVKIYIRSALSDILDEFVDGVSLDKNVLFEDIGLDSIDVLEIITELEDVLRIDIEEDIFKDTESLITSASKSYFRV